MPIYLGTDKIKNMWLGDSKIKNIWLGTDKVYSALKTLGTWVQASGVPSDTSIRSMAYGNGKFILTTNLSNASWYVSTNGKVWNAFTPPFRDTALIRYIPSQGLWVAVESGTSGTSLPVYYSQDGITWSTKTFTISQQMVIYNLCGDSNYVYVVGWGVGSSTAGMIATVDIANNTVNSYANGNIGRIYSIACSNDTRNIVAFPNYTANYLQSTDGVTWTERTLPSTINPTVYKKTSNYINGKFYVCGEERKMASSTDGINWTLNSTGNRQVCSIAYCGGWYIMPTGGGYLKSTDGETWEHVSTIYGLGDIDTNGNDIFVRVTGTEVYYMELT